MIMLGAWKDQAEFVGTVIDAYRPFQWLVQIGACKPIRVSLTYAQWDKMPDIAPGDKVRIKFRAGRKLPRIIGYADPRR
jgi:hypothetical protein